MRGRAAIIAALALIMAIIALALSFFPLHHTGIIEAAAAEHGISASLLAAMVKTESGWDEKALSRKGAKGLLQLTDDTFIWLIEKRDDGESAARIYDPGVNIDYGAYYIAYLYDRYKDEKTALAAYNAGPSRVDGWLLEKNLSDDGKKLDRAPFPETAEYIKRVTLYKRVYEELYPFLKEEK